MDYFNYLRGTFNYINMSIQRFLSCVLLSSLLIFSSCSSDENGAYDSVEVIDSATEEAVETAAEKATFFDIAVKDLPIMDATDSESIANFFAEMKTVVTEKESDLIQAGFKYYANNRPLQIYNAAISEGAEFPTDDTEALTAALIEAMYSEMDGKNADELMLMFAACMDANGDLELSE